MPYPIALHPTPKLSSPLGENAPMSTIARHGTHLPTAVPPKPTASQTFEPTPCMHHTKGLPSVPLLPAQSPTLPDFRINLTQTTSSSCIAAATLATTTMTKERKKSLTGTSRGISKQTSHQRTTHFVDSPTSSTNTRPPSPAPSLPRRVSHRTTTPANLAHQPLPVHSSIARPLCPFNNAPALGKADRPC